MVVPVLDAPFRFFSAPWLEPERRGFTMASIQAKNFNTPDEKRTPPHTTMEIVNFGDMTVARVTYAPGWRWSQDIKPVVGTDSCQVPHFGAIISGRIHVKMDDGTEQELGPGSIGIIPSGHDAWVIGDQPVIWIDFQGASRNV
jgi:hypothetical protein